jgi:hypothetical protein
MQRDKIQQQRLRASYGEKGGGVPDRKSQREADLPPNRLITDDSKKPVPKNEPLDHEPIKASGGSAEEDLNKLKKFRRDWVCYQCFVPLISIFFAWLIAYKLPNNNNRSPLDLFFETIIDGNLIIYSACLLVGVFVELDRWQLAAKQGIISQIDLLATIVRVACIFLFCFFVALKAIITYAPPKPGEMHFLSLWVLASLISVIAAYVFSGIAFFYYSVFFPDRTR